MESLARAAAGVVLAVAAATGPTIVTGTFALSGGTQHSYARAIVSYPRPNEVTLDIKESTTPGGPPIRSYMLEMTKLMHVIVIRDDFREFMHLHPAFDRKTGIFRVTIDGVDRGHAYNVFADSEPQKIGQQVFRFALPATGRAAGSTGAQSSATPGPASVNAGPYTVKLATTTLVRNAPQAVAVDILVDAKPATNLEPYLGAAGHAVFVNTKTLAYAHVHPMVKNSADMEMKQHDDAMAKTGPHMMMHVPALPAGSYKLWFEFQGSGTTYTAPFTLVVH